MDHLWKYKKNTKNNGFWRFEDLPAGSATDKCLHDKAFNIAKNPKDDGYQRGVASMIYKFFDKTTAATNTGTGLTSENQQLEEELHYPIIKKKMGKKLYSPLKDNMWGDDPADTQLISKYNRIWLLLCLIDNFSK